MYQNDFLRMLEDMLRAQYRPPTHIGTILGVPVIYDPYIEAVILGNDGIVNACVHRSTIYVNNDWLKAPQNIQIGIIGHEIGHLLNGDLDPVRRLYGPGRHTQMEIDADKRAVQLTCKNDVLSYLYLIRDQHIAVRRKKLKWSHDHARGILKNLNEINLRVAAIEAM